MEGPFGDHTGYYSLADLYPKFHITAITHRKNAVYPATIVGIPPQEDAWIGKATERIFLTPMKMTIVPEIKDMELPIEGIFHNITIIKIEKTYPGQGPKVMNAMWGAGQMMLNKMLIVVDEDIDIHNYTEVAICVSENVDPQIDFHFSQGPIDVLDHSCSKMAFGGKMGIDATKKYDEELRTKDYLNVSPPHDLDKESLMDQFSEIKDINDSLLKTGISLVIIAVEKKRIHHIQELNESLFAIPQFQHVKMIIFLEHTIDISHLGDVVWRFTNNIDPNRDSFIIPAIDKNSISHVGFDGTRKTKEMDDFDREWPNIIVMDETTINNVDEKWDKLGLGSFIESPSVRYRKQLYKGGAVV